MSDQKQNPAGTSVAAGDTASAAAITPYLKEIADLKSQLAEQTKWTEHWREQVTYWKTVGNEVVDAKNAQLAAKDALLEKARDLAQAVKVAGQFSGTAPRVGDNDPFRHMVGLALDLFQLLDKQGKA